MDAITNGSAAAAIKVARFTVFPASAWTSFVVYSVYRSGQVTGR
jgi:hypothetical protein